MTFRRVAVIGMARSGKTTFVTAMIDHWLNHDPNRMPLKGKKEILCHWKNEHSLGKKTFASNRQRFSEKLWPIKTLKPMSYLLAWKYASEYFYRDIEIVDIPGERLADADMLVCKSLADWSSHMVHYYGKVDPTTRKTFNKFDKLFEEARTSDHSVWLDELEDAYREFIYFLITSKHPLVTPSSMLIDHQGNCVPREYRSDLDQLKKWLAESASLGIGEKRLFPLPNALLNTPAGRTMQKTYQDYVKQVVEPSLAPLASSQDVIVLTDVSAVLELGPAYKNTVSDLYGQIVKFMHPGSLLWRRLQDTWSLVSHYGSFTTYNYCRTERVLIVASKADRIHDKYQNDLLELAQQLARPAFKQVRAASVVEVNYYVVAAVKSTVSEPNGIIQYTRLLDGKREEVQVPAQSLPVEFGDDWKIGDFRFPKCEPQMPANKANPSQQVGLQQLTEKILV